MDAPERLITTTQELLWAQGYVATSPRQIQRRAAVGQGSFYHHFEGKADLAATAVRRSAKELQAELDEVFSRPGSPVERLIAFLRRERDAVRGCRVGCLAHDPEIRAHADLRAPIVETFTWLRARLIAVIVEAQQAGELPRSVVPEHLASLLSATVQGGYVLSRAQNDPEPLSEATEGAVALLLALGACSSRRQAR